MMKQVLYSVLSFTVGKIFLSEGLKYNSIITMLIGLGMMGYAIYIMGVLAVGYAKYDKENYKEEVEE